MTLPKGHYGTPRAERFRMPRSGGPRPIDTARLEVLLAALEDAPKTLPELVELTGAAPLYGERTRAKHSGDAIRGVPYLIRLARAAGARIEASPTAPVTYRRPT